MSSEQLLLSLQERDRLESLENIVTQGLKTFIEVGAALLEIRDKRLYRADFDTFEDYCRGRWQMSRRHADRLIESAEVAENLRPIGLIPTHESQVRPLTKFEPEQQREAWQIAAQISPNPTAAQIQQVAETVQRAIADAQRDCNSYAELERQARTPIPGKPNPPFNDDWIEFKGSLRRLLKIEPFDAAAIVQQELQIHSNSPNLTQEVINQCEEALSRIQEFLDHVQS